MIAAWNTFVKHEGARQVVPGMAPMYRELLGEQPGTPIVYVSTGAWNTAPTLNRFLRNHGYPVGPAAADRLGSDQHRLVPQRAGAQARVADRLAEDFPNIRWILVGDDGQHDPKIYAGLRRGPPRLVEAIAIRQLTPTEQVLSHGLPVSNEELQPRSSRGRATCRSTTRPTATACCEILRVGPPGKDEQPSRPCRPTADSPDDRLRPCRSCPRSRRSSTSSPSARTASPSPLSSSARSACSRPSTRRRPRSPAAWSTVVTARQVPRPRRRRHPPRLPPGPRRLAALVRGAARHGDAAGQVADRAAGPVLRRVGVRPHRGRHEEVPRRLHRPRPERGARHRPARPRPDGRRLRRATRFARDARGAPHPDQGAAARPGVPRRRRQRVLRRDPPRGQAVALRASPARSKPQDVQRLYAALRDTLAGAVVAASGKPAAELKDAKREPVCGCTAAPGKPCPVCGDTVREVSFADSSLQYCADLPDRRQAARRPPDVPAAEVTSAGRRPVCQNG